MNDDASWRVYCMSCSEEHDGRTAWFYVVPTHPGVREYVCNRWVCVEPDRPGGGSVIQVGTTFEQRGAAWATVAPDGGPIRLRSGYECLALTERVDTSPRNPWDFGGGSVEEATRPLPPSELLEPEKELRQSNIEQPRPVKLVVSPTPRILVTGGRDYADRVMVYELLDEVLAATGPFTLVHGGARGADRLAHEWAVSRGVAIERVPAEWDKHGKKAGMLRNAEMVARGAALCVAFPGGRGTADCAGRAERAGIPVRRVTGVSRG